MFRKSQKLTVATLCLLAITALNVGAAVAKTQDYIPVSWEQLIPADYDLEALENDVINQYDSESLEPGSAEVSALYFELQSLQDNAPMTREYNETRIKIPGFVVPLEFDGDKITHFLLVPYYGACIHTPPPPPNQIVYVILQEGVQIDDIYYPVYVNGLMRVERQESELGAAGYTLYGESIEPYK
jgi:hypothetical protein